MRRGKIKWFDEEKGYGVISAPGHKDVFVQASEIVETEEEVYSSIRSEGRSLAKGTEVSFEVTSGNKGLEAQSVVKLS